jgi:hypothetical protein
MRAFVTRYLTRKARTRGFLGGSRLWTAVGVVLYGARLLSRFTGGGTKVVYSERLDAGETLVISSPGSDVEVVPRDGA